MWTVQMDEEDFRIVGPNGEESEVTPYGSAAVVEAVEGTVFCYIEDPNDPDEEPKVKRIVTAETLESETADVEFEDEDEGGDEADEADEGEEEEEPVEVKAETD